MTGGSGSEGDLLGVEAREDVAEVASGHGEGDLGHGAARRRRVGYLEVEEGEGESKVGVAMRVWAGVRVGVRGGGEG